MENPAETEALRKSPPPQEKLGPKHCRNVFKNKIFEGRNPGNGHGAPFSSNMDEIQYLPHLHPAEHREDQGEDNTEAPEEARQTPGGKGNERRYNQESQQANYQLSRH